MSDNFRKKNVEKHSKNQNLFTVTDMPQLSR